MARQPVDSSLDLLEEEDRILQGLFEAARCGSDRAAENCPEDESAAKRIVRHGAIREACVVDVRDVIREIPEIRSVANRWLTRTTRRRLLLNRVGDLSWGIQGTRRSLGPDVDDMLRQLIDEMVGEIEWELSEALPAVWRSMTVSSHSLLHSARYVRRYTPTRFNPSGPSWVERNPIASRTVDIWGQLRDRPRAVPRSRTP
jgi:hypothetical protein